MYEKVARMIFDRIEYFSKKASETNDTNAAASATAYKSCYMMLYCAHKYYIDELNLFDYYNRV